MKRIFKLLSIFILSVFIFSSCSKSNVEDINIIYTTDVHCGIEDNFTYAGVSSYKKNLKNESKYVSLVDCGDALQGGFIGSVSKGEYIIEIMNKVGYDILTLGNHEFDYGMDELSKRIDEFNGNVLSCNIKYTGKNENKLSKVSSYEIIKYGSVKVGYVGVTTPSSITDSTPANFMEDGSYVYNFTNDTKEEFYSCIQSSVNEVKKKGAKYVVLLAHLGDGSGYAEYSSQAVCQNTYGIDVILDGHAHKTIELEYYKNQKGKDVPLSEAGTDLSNIGLLTIKKNGKIEVKLETDSKVVKPDTLVAEYVSTLTAAANELGKKIVCSSNQELKITDSNGIRLVRNRETEIGNLIADAYSYAAQTEIAFVNGGGIRKDLKSGDISFLDIQAIHPYGNTICVMNVKGSAIIDYLEFVTRFTESEYVKDGKANGEFGGFASVSGIKFKVDTSKESTVKVDSNNIFVSVEGERRVYDVYVLSNNSYEKIDLNKTYQVASSNYILLSGGDGASMFMNDGELVKKDIMLDYEAVINYIVDGLDGNIKDNYSSTQGRIVIE